MATAPPGPTGPLTQIYGPLDDAPVELLDADQTLTVAGGRRYRQFLNPLTAFRRKSLSHAGAVIGDIILIERIDDTPHQLRVLDGVGGPFIGASVGPRTVAAYRFDGANWQLNRALPTTTSYTLYNVRDFGADGLDGQGNLPAVEAAAIQACIDAAALATNAAPGSLFDGAVIYVPRGRYRIDGHTLIWRRTQQFHPLWLVGDGWSITTIVNGTQFDNVIEAESVASDPDLTHGAFQHVIANIGLVSYDGACFEYVIGGPGVIGDAQRPAIHFHRVYASRAQATGNGGAFHIEFSFRCRFTDIVTSLGPTGGVSFVLDTPGGAYLDNCTQNGVAGAMMRAVGPGGEISMKSCRSEGSQQRASFYFENLGEISLTAVTTEGHVENPALFVFKDCNTVACNVIGLAIPSAPYVGTTYADGMQLINCRGVAVTMGDTGTFRKLDGAAIPAGDGLARAIRIDAACRDVHIYITAKGNAGATADDVALDPAAYDCQVSYSTPIGTRRYGKTILHALDVENNAIEIRATDAAALPTGIQGVAIDRGTTSNQVAMWWSESAQSFIAAFDLLGDHATLGNRVKVEMLEALFPSSAIIRAAAGQTVNMFDNATLIAFFQLVGGVGKLRSGTAAFELSCTTGTLNITTTTGLVQLSAGGNVDMYSGGVLHLRLTGGQSQFTGKLKLNTTIDPAANGEIGKGATGRLVQYVASQARAVLSEVRFPWNKENADGLAVDATAEHVLLVAKEAITVRGADWIGDATVTANGSNYATITISKRDGAGGAASTVLTLVSSSSWTQFIAIVFSGLANNTLAAGNILTIKIDKTGLGVIVPKGAITLAYTVDQ